MGFALAMAILLVVVVGVLSLAMNAQGPIPGQRGPGASRSSHPGSGGAASRPLRRPARDRPERPDKPDKPERPPRERGPSERAERRERAAHPDASPSGPAARAPSPEEANLFADVRPLNSQAQALVISVVDERTLGPVTRSRLTLRVEPVHGEAFEVTTRVAFPTPEHRAKVKVGATIPVRYDSDDHRRVVVDTDGDAGPGA